MAEALEQEQAQTKGCQESIRAQCGSQRLEQHLLKLENTIVQKREATTLESMHPCPRTVNLQLINQVKHERIQSVWLRKELKCNTKYVVTQ